MEIMKELIPVIQEAIRSGSSVAIWYLIGIQVTSLLKFFGGWFFVLLVFKGIYTLLMEGLKNDI